MEKQLNISTNYQDNHWLNTVESITLAGSVSGSIASIFFKEIMIVSIPLSACIAFNLLNRKRLFNLTTAKNNQAIATLAEHNQNDHANICDQIMQLEQFAKEKQHQDETEREAVAEKLKQLSLNSEEQIKQLESQYQQLASKTVKIAQNTTSTSAELYYQNANGYQKMGEKQKAIDEYSRAIKIDKLYAEAYVNRGELSAELGHKQIAVQDLRQAAKLYFERGDLDNYQKIKQKTQEIYQLGSKHSAESQNSAEVLTGSLFS